MGGRCVWGRGAWRGVAAQRTIKYHLRKSPVVFLSGDPSRQYDGLSALGASVAVAGVAIGVVLIAVAALAWRWPEARAVLHPLHLLIIIAQALDGATTWVGVMNPFGLDLPNYEEQVYLSRLILDHLGGFVYFVIKILLGICIVAALEFAFRNTKTKTELRFTRLVQIALVVISFIPVWNNVMNFLAIV